ncbi:UDP:flavonoid glycosyltransferase YjiC, YdhE family [Streptoalloteichus tenebrarius]|uniref:UDP:flavonoid glycosyltransferase YjiC, YdhE family n=1 Tax=Streptoalloteichus tenebrarius (strain ATCC 17920 / DSM 40477 / JCM 4838 / CBS 697.72 / NBRC 16177 / NCIMB 11028 / NRRL B-12390 / A12253. 1 / ISP 5477) TaxID=1933 RepID=A0ABT1I234_STRSD|nr:glycosyltransferase [Streptoalloteichus tenebrarius]MCP2261852.1 UDP:flavonoid glycosyltransferase YjiC, YdhE family [Streptoalloteichus tenebrarius]BFE99998.1 glycosyltransferase [Streptoalloteichus tenebrarius]
MSRVAILTAGSHGDVAPYVGLGVELRAAGHHVTIAVSERFHDYVTGAGLAFHSLPDLDVRDTGVAEAADAANNTGARAAFALIRLGVEVFRRQLPAMIEAVRQADVLLCSHPTVLFGRQIAEAVKIPCVVLPLQPAEPSRYLGPMALGGRNLGPTLNVAVANVVARGAYRMFAGVVRDLRAQLGLPPVSPDAIRRRYEAHPLRSLHGVSPVVVPRPTDWPDTAEMVGYWWPPRPAGWEPPAELVDFLAAGPPPVYVGFGSMGANRREQLQAVVQEALARSGLRAIVHRGWAELAVKGDDVLMVDHVPHDWLFPQVAAVVHHAGAGTTAAGLRAGVPAVPVPLAHDQPFWAQRLLALGVAPAVVPTRQLTGDRLAAALAYAVGAPALRRRAEAVARRIGAEDGAARVREVVEGVVARVG